MLNLTTKNRRDEIIKALKESETPVKGTEIAKQFGVSRQVIVQDIAILRARGEEIVATPQGYMILKKYEVPKIVKTITSSHEGYDEIEDELNIIVDMGGKILDVTVEHPVYGEITSKLMLESRKEIEEFIKQIKDEKAEPLSKLTGGIHLHTIEVPSEEVFEEIKNRLKDKNYLIDN